MNSTAKTPSNSDDTEIRFVMNEQGTYAIGKSEKRLADFSAWIVEQIRELDGDGDEPRVTAYVINCRTRLGSRNLTVGLQDFERMNWTARLGTEGVVSAGIATRDLLRQAIMEHSRDASVVDIHCHLGWTRIKGRDVFLHSGGGIDATGSVPDLRVEVDPVLAAFNLPEPPSGKELQACLKAALAVAEVAPLRCTIPLLGTVFGAPLGHSRQSVHLHGVSGVRKTELAALAQRFFGTEMNADHLPLGWNSTDNALLRPLHLAKDTLIVLDDFRPQGTRVGEVEMDRLAERVFRGQANQQGRARLRPDGTLRPVHRPRGTVLSTGEAVPSGKSLVARMLCVRVRDGDVQIDRLTECQRYAEQGLFAGAMAAYVSWLAANQRLQYLQKLVGAREIAWRTADEFEHGRQNDAAARLDASIETMLSFMVDAGVIDREQARMMLDQGREALIEACREHTEEIRDADPVDRFIECVTSLLTTCKVHLQDPDGRMPSGGVSWGWLMDEQGRTRSGGTNIGWLDHANGLVLLDPQASFQAVQRYSGLSGQGLGVGPKVLSRTMYERGLLVRTDSGRNTYKATIRGRRKNVLALDVSLFQGNQEEPPQIAV